MLNKIIAITLPNTHKLTQLLKTTGKEGDLLAAELLKISQQILPTTESLKITTNYKILPEMNWHGITFKGIPAVVNASLGSPEEKDNPVHQVTLGSFYIMETPLTQTQYQKITGNNPSKFDGETNPVETVSWFEAVDYTKALSLQTEDISKDVKNKIKDLSPEQYQEYALNYPKSGLFRLPTEAEWEYAAGQEDNIKDIDSYAQCSRNNDLKSTQPVGKLNANKFGLKDIIGNVLEWTADWHHEHTFINNPPAINPKGPENGSHKVLKGSSWSDRNDNTLQSSYRYINNPETQNSYIGFRIVKTIP